MKKKIVVCLIGQTGAGKDTVAGELVKHTGWKKIVSYTDAPKRSDQQNGREHWFMSREEMTRILKEKDILAETAINGNRYCTTLDQLSDGISIYIIDPKGFDELDKRNDLTLIPCVIIAGRAIRKKRASSRKNFDFDSRNTSEEKQFEEFYVRVRKAECRDDAWPTAFFGNTGTPEECADDILRYVKMGLEEE